MDWPDCWKPSRHNPQLCKPNIPADSLSRQSMNSNNESESFLAANMTGNVLHEEELVATFKNLTSLEIGNVECNVLYWVIRIIRNFVVQENEMSRRTVNGLGTMTSIPSRGLLMRTFQNIRRNRDLKLSNNPFWTDLGGLSVKLIYIGLREFLRWLPTTWADSKVSKTHLSPYFLVIWYFVQWFCRTIPEDQSWKQVHLNRCQALERLAQCDWNWTCYGGCQIYFMESEVI